MGGKARSTVKSYSCVERVGFPSVIFDGTEVEKLGLGYQPCPLTLNLERGWGYQSLALKLFHSRIVLFLHSSSFLYI